MFAIAQKEAMGLDKAVEDSKYAMRRYGVNPNLLIIPPQVNSCSSFSTLSNHTVVFSPMS